MTEFHEKLKALYRTGILNHKVMRDIMSRDNKYFKSLGSKNPFEDVKKKWSPFIDTLYEHLKKLGHVRIF